jgi:hypothetical protein
MPFERNFRQRHIRALADLTKAEPCIKPTAAPTGLLPDGSLIEDDSLEVVC